MSEKNVVGQIKINFVDKGRPEIEIIGEVRSRAIPGLTRNIQMAYRKYRQSIARSKPAVDMSDKGNVQTESQEAVPAPSAMDNLYDTTPTKPPVTEEMVVEDALEEVEEVVEAEPVVEEKKNPYATD